MIKVAHIYASMAKRNSGDYILGISTKEYFKEKYLSGEDCIFTDMNCRDESLYNSSNVDKLNEYDYILVGGGGLILPDTAPNKISAWQWVIPKENYKRIKKPIYVISIGYNLFYEQSMNMYNRENSIEDKNRISIFSDNITELIKKSKHFSVRHSGDKDRLLEIIGNEYLEMVDFEYCPSIWYMDKYHKDKMDIKSDKYIVLEIKDDREWRRYHKISKNVYYRELEKFVIYCLDNKIKIGYMSHDGSENFFNYLKSKKINIKFFDNSVANEKSIVDNYSNVSIILCSAGHSQMMSHGLGIKKISLISHPKLKYFCEDTGDDNYIEINNDNSIFDKIKSIYERL